MRGPRKALAVVAAIALVATLAFAATPASAAPGAGVIVFRAVATAQGVCYPGAHILTPGCGATGLLGDEHFFTWSNDIFTGSGLDFCAAVDSLASPPYAVATEAGPAVGSCDIVSSGSGGGTLRVNGSGIGPVHPGGWCGLSSGWGSGTSTVNGHATSDGVMWVTSAATVLPIEDGNLSNTVYSAGVVDAIGSVGGNCGITTVSQKFNVVGVSAAVGL